MLFSENKYDVDDDDISRNRREAPCERILTKFRTSRDMADVIICAKFDVEKLRG